jgi:FKBP-type peptidyl-prolyl cis-trans isomerase 2
LKHSQNTQVIFHYKVRRADTLVVIDDSEDLGLGPFELRLGSHGSIGQLMVIDEGKKFVVEDWEEALRSMCVGERASFVVSPEVSVTHPSMLERQGLPEGK